MSTGNMNSLNKEEHDDVNNAKKVLIVGSNVTVNVAASFSGNVTLDPGSKVGVVGNVTVQQGSTPWVSSLPSGATVYQGTSPWITSQQGNVTITDSKGFIGLVTTVSGQAWPDPKTYIGLVTVDIGTNNSVAIKGNVTLSDPKTFIGSVSVGGLVDSKGYIGLVTTTLVGFSSLYTSLASIVSASGLATILIPPSGKIAVIKDFFVSSLGRSEISFWRVNSSTTGIRIPWTSLSTTSGYIGSFGDSGLNVGGADDGLTSNLNGAATVSYMMNVKFI